MTHRTPSGAADSWAMSDLTPGRHLFLILIWVLPFLSLPFKGIVFSLLGLQFWTTHIYLYLVLTLLLATCLGCCLPYMCGSSTQASYIALPPPQCDVASLGKPSMVLLPQYCVLPAVHQMMC